MQSRIEAADGHVAVLRAYVAAQSAGVHQRLALFEEHFRSGQELACLITWHVWYIRKEHLDA